MENQGTEYRGGCMANIAAMSQSAVGESTNRQRAILFDVLREMLEWHQKKPANMLTAGAASAMLRLATASESYSEADLPMAEKDLGTVILLATQMQSSIKKTRQSGIA